MGKITKMHTTAKFKLTKLDVKNQLSASSTPPSFN